MEVFSGVGAGPRQDGWRSGEFLPTSGGRAWYEPMYVYTPSLHSPQTSMLSVRQSSTPTFTPQLPTTDPGGQWWVGW